MNKIFALSDEAVELWSELDPFAAAINGLVRQAAVWPDCSPAGFDSAREKCAELLTAANDIETDSHDEDTAKRILVDELENRIRTIDAKDHTWDLNNIASPWQGMTGSFDLFEKETPEDWAAIAHLLETIDSFIAGYQASLTAGIENGFPPARRQVIVAIEQGRITEGAQSAFRLLGNECTVADEQLRLRLDTAIEHACSTVGAATDWMETTLLAAARPEDAVGEARYATAARKHLGSEIDLRETYSWGWSEIASLRARLTELCAQVDPNKSVAEVMEFLNTDPGLAAQGVDEFLTLMLDRQTTALANLAGTHFDVPEEIRAIEVKSPPEGGATAPYYTGPSDDFTRPGCVWYPIYGRTQFPLYDEITTAYHEGFPGHHLQVAFARTLKEQLSRFHQLYVWYSGSGEGWALYAERLMGELGYLEKPEYEIGLVTSQLFRSCRVVIDIGSHVGLPIPDDAPINPGGEWSFDSAVEMLESVAFLSSANATSEIVRYLGWPGQAITYKLGEKVILDLRAEFEGREGFDLKQFHVDLLTAGAIGIDVMCDLVRAAQTRRLP